ncbi:MAG: type II toxin-antitoxin system VapC family toxin [Kiritimatiellae bacterium]|jgi:predicted nucleic acid-binding protein|nr:type II toxin-antitoxin system VapC family toxin [Kiritimatiellia bacterium]NLG01644.1 type II toxin-antitoxin system VapC family toxin [Lentisphaerota bacterium]
MIFDSDVMIWAFRGNKKALKAIDHADSRAISSVTYMELLQGVRNKDEMREMKKFLSKLSFSILPVTTNISNRAISIMEECALKSELGVCDSLIFATACETGDTLLSGNKKHFKEVAFLTASEFKPE